MKTTLWENDLVMLQSNVCYGHGRIVKIDGDKIRLVPVDGGHWMGDKATMTVDRSAITHVFDRKIQKFARFSAAPAVEGA